MLASADICTYIVSACLCVLPFCVLVLRLCWQNTCTGLSAKKYRELDARMKATEDELQVKKKEVKQLEAALQCKSDALTSLDGLGERSKGEWLLHSSCLPCPRLLSSAH